MADRSLLYLTLVMAFFSFSSAVTGIFLPNYYLQLGLSVDQIALLMAAMFVTLGILPVLTLKFLPKSFERLIMVGLIFGMVFYVMLIYVKNPLLLGLVLGLSYATYWPAFNLLLFRLTDIKRRGFVISLLYVVVPTLTGIIGPFFGGTIISFLGFDSLFILGIVLLFLSLIVSFGIKYERVKADFAILKSKLLLFFAAITAINGFADIGFVAYPLFLHQLTGSFLGMGVIAAVLSAIVAVISLVAGKISSVEKHRITLTLVGFLAGSIWLILLAFVQNLFQLVAISAITGISSAFGALFFSLYGDFFKRKQHATIVVLWEVFLMFGRLANLIPVAIFISAFDFKDYFILIGVLSLSASALLVLMKMMHSSGRIAIDRSQ